MTPRHYGPLPLCACGCGRRVKKFWRRKGQPTKYATLACVPREVRQQACRKGRRTWALKTRLARFRGEIHQLQGQRVTGEDLLEVFKRIERRAYNSGFQRGRAQVAPPTAQAQEEP